MLFQVLEPIQEIAERETENGTQQRNVIISFSVTLGVMLSIVAVTTKLYCTTRRLVSHSTIVPISKH